MKSLGRPSAIGSFKSREEEMRKKDKTERVSIRKEMPRVACRIVEKRRLAVLVVALSNSPGSC